MHKVATLQLAKSDKIYLMGMDGSHVANNIRFFKNYCVATLL